ncbi:MAG: response regulator [Bacteroidia bacterium]
MINFHYVLIIDDDPVNNFLCRQLLHQMTPETVIHDFTNPLDGIRFLQDGGDTQSANDKILLLLDINMPGMNGWEFMDEFAKLPASLTSKFTIHILSSSVDPDDKNRADANPQICSFVEKPLTLLKIDSLLRIS